MSFIYVGKEHYITLITKKLNNELSTSELRELNSWLSTGSGNANLVSDFKNVWNTVATYKADTVFNVDVAYNNFVKKYNLTPSSSRTSSKRQPNSSLSLARIFFALLTLAALVYGGFKLAAKINNTVSNDSLTAMSLPLSSFSTATIAPSSTVYFDKKDFSISNLSGQVYLELDEQNGSSPLRLNLDDVSANANNATLNLQRFSKDNLLVADVSDGSVDFLVNDEKVNLEEGKRLIYDKKSKNYQLTDSDNKVFEWKKGVLTFDNSPLNEAFETIEKFYGVNITITDDSKLDAHITAFNMKEVTLDQCLEIVQGSVNMTIVRKGLKEIEISNIQAK